MRRLGRVRVRAGLHKHTSAMFTSTCLARSAHAWLPIITPLRLNLWHTRPTHLFKLLPEHGLPQVCLMYDIIYWILLVIITIPCRALFPTVVSKETLQRMCRILVKTSDMWCDLLRISNFAANQADWILTSQKTRKIKNYNISLEETCKAL